MESAGCAPRAVGDGHIGLLRNTNSIQYKLLVAILGCINPPASSNVRANVVGADRIRRIWVAPTLHIADGKETRKPCRDGRFQRR